MSQEKWQWTFDSNDLVLINGVVKICVDEMLTQWHNEKRRYGLSIDRQRVKDIEAWLDWREGALVG